MVVVVVCVSVTGNDKGLGQHLRPKKKKIQPGQLPQTPTSLFSQGRLGDGRPPGQRAIPSSPTSREGGRREGSNSAMPTMWDTNVSTTTNLKAGFKGAVETLLEVGKLLLVFAKLLALAQLAAASQARGPQCQRRAQC